MPITTEEFQLILDLGNSGKDVAEVNAAIAKLKQTSQEAGKAFESLEKPAESSSKSMASLSRGALQTSQALQDVAQGGIASALNNVDGIVGSLAKGFGLTATSAAAMSAGILGVGTALLIAGPPLYKWYQSLAEGSNEIPKTTDALNAYTEAIKDNAKWLEEAASKGSLTDAELVEYNRRLAENTQLEKDSAEAKKAKATAEKLAAVQTKEAAADAKAAADILQDALAGKTDDVIASVTANMRGASKELRDASKVWELTNKEYSDSLANATDPGRINDIIAIYTKKLDEQRKTTDEIRKRIGSDAANLVGDAVLQGSQEAIDKIAQLTKGNSAFADVFKSVNRQLQDQRIKEATEGWDEVVKYIDDQAAKVAKKSQEAVEKAADIAWAGLRKLNEDLAREAEKEQEAADKDARDHPGQDVIRDVEASDFQQTAIDKNGREKTFGARLSSDQVRAAADAAGQFQRDFGLNDRSAAQAAIQEQIIRNQQQMADRQQQSMVRLQNIYGQAQTVPSLLQWGGL
ncbi:hypothetical protein [Paludisphaera rhizosphaerae]|uniref:hypothetical protein n=1 Tax=Paludisphaera rhizosphaerae TaxID=2711216 RepID=UPI0013ED4EB5|nr:hypothetical protein [Paludisphaera rhizosphaerae]